MDNDEDGQSKKFIVETETVEAPESNLLLSASNKLPGNNVTSVTETDVSPDITTSLPNNPNLTTTNSNNSATFDRSRGVEPSIHSFQDDHISGVSELRNESVSSNIMPHLDDRREQNKVETNSSTSHNTLIDNNPLSTHLNQSSLRNKKSKLLVESPLVPSVNREDEPNHTKDDLSKNQFPRKSNIIDDLLKVSERPTKLNNNDADKNRTLLKVKESINKTKNDADSPATTRSQSTSKGKQLVNMETPLMLNTSKPVLKDDTSAVNARSSVDQKLDNNPIKKIIERPPIQSMNSREVLLTPDAGKDNKHPKISNLHMTASSSSNSNNSEANPKEKNVPSKNLASTEDIHSQFGLDGSSQKPTKADFFAARLASAVGENEGSDSEETFVYESAANSTKNLIYPNASSVALNLTASGTGNAISLANNTNDVQQNKVPGVAPKMSVPVLNSNKKLMSRLKNTRHVSTGGMPALSASQQPPVIAAAPSNVASNLSAVINADSVTSSNAPRSKVHSNSHNNSNNRNNDDNSNNNNNVDEMTSLRSISHQSYKPNDVRSIRSFISEQQHVSPDRHKNVTGFTHSTKDTKHLQNTAQRSSSMKPSYSNLTLRQNISTNKMNLEDSANNYNPDSKRVLRTTVSKIFDSNNTPLRRYSGVPDHINLEDYIEQANDYNVVNSHQNPHNSNGSLMHSNSVKINSSYLTNNNDSRRMVSNSHPTNDNHATWGPVENDYGNGSNVGNSTNNDNNYYYNEPSAIEEVEEEEQFKQSPASHTATKDDNDEHSMFYYNHRSDLEARPQISDYEDDDGVDVVDEEGIDPRYYHQVHGSPSHFQGYKSMNGYYDYSFASSADQYPRQNVNEYTPLKVSQQPGYRRKVSRNQIDYSPHNFYTKKSTWSKLKHFIYFSFIVISLMTVGFVFGFTLATNKELQNFDIVLIDNVISTKEELIFDATASAFNPGFFTISIFDAELDIFAKSQYTRARSGDKSKEVETILLGRVNELDNPLSFQGGFFNRNYDVSMSSFRILNPGSIKDDETELRVVEIQDDDNEKKWGRLIKHDYQLILRGNLKYRIPFFNNEKSLAIQKTVEISVEDEGDTIMRSITI
ncbi:hypothetical protein KAFR_0J01120 [Kazachstania africana CBS 2517]|uniref:Vacuolar segregation protein 7 n=1 Tax=Kazachstania africana (strain ATCC 22294 / BCRC 22015 / CBS 2517 / CECT 1963 / NBRC 1671 / NRRL Y-8276) TaxID=1071382 RepID=H2B0M9_KAZAF|nr:hypothetical protein KAFR_0J01120 [Kazachstania africana CBS 2517]CCF60179.1 hypothetical protein KAFR_0J01120 [Kazachstania africana CBS 2517]